jgi:imidazolonepropionase-like amidohydrolase
MVDCHTHMGIIEESIGKLGFDNNETSDPVTPHIRAIDAVNPMDVAFLDAIKSLCVHQEATILLGVKTL